MTIIELFNSIDLPTESDNFMFSAISIPEFSNHRIAKDKLGNPSLLLAVDDQNQFVSSPNFKLLNVLVLYDVKCSILQNNFLIYKNFTVISFIGKDNQLKNYFITLCDTLLRGLGNSPLCDAVRNEISRFVELFRLATEPQIKTVQGLWAELFLISESLDPKILVRCWHCIPEEKFDFNNGAEKIEVKSSSNGLRLHNFSIDQLHSSGDSKIIVASLFVNQSSTGTSIANLIDEIKSKLSTNLDLINKLELQIASTLGKSLMESFNLNFDYQLAKDSLRFFRAEDIPKIELEKVPPSVIDVRFKSDLSELNSINPTDFNADGDLFSALR